MSEASKKDKQSTNEAVEVDIKQRLIGAIVLVSLGIIFIPLLLNGGFYRNTVSPKFTIEPMPEELTQDLTRIPEPLTMPAPKMIAAIPVRDDELVETSQATQADAKKEDITPLSKPSAPSTKTVKTIQTAEVKAKPLVKTVKTIKPKPNIVKKASFKVAKKPSNKKINKAYAIQVASFSDKSNALKLQKRLRHKKYKAYVERVNTTKGLRYRLRVGPYLKFTQISQIKKNIERHFKLKDTVIIIYKS